MSVPDRPLREAGSQSGWHACALFDGEDQEYQALLPFARDCFHCHDRCVHFVDPLRRQQRLDRLAEIPLDAEEAFASGQLDLRTWQQVYLREGRFDQQDMLGVLAELLRAGEAAFGRTRLWANMDWVLSRVPGCEQVFEYESRLNLVLHGRRDMVLCVYDTRRHDAHTLLNVLRTHPFVVVGEVLRMNPLYIAPERFLAQAISFSGGGAKLPAP